MARYDQSMGRGRVGFSREAGRGQGGYGWGRSGPDNGGWSRQASGYDRDQRYSGAPYPQDVTRGGGWQELGAGVYGPARYGLGPYYQRLLDRRRPDDELKEEVEEALFYDSWVDAEAIAVEVDDGVVTLRGQLPSFEEIRYAIDDAWDVDGVRGVRAELELRGRDA